MRRVCQAISRFLAKIYLKSPRTAKGVKFMAAKFYEQHGFPQCIGATGVTHVLIKKLSGTSISTFINRKRNYTINWQAVPNYSYCFFNVVVKWPGNVPDNCIFANSSLNSLMRNQVIPSCRGVITDGKPEVPVCLLGDPAYPLLLFMIKEFANDEKTLQKNFFGLSITCTLPIWLKSQINALLVFEVHLLHKQRNLQN